MELPQKPFLTPLDEALVLAFGSGPPDLDDVELINLDVGLCRDPASNLLWEGVDFDGGQRLCKEEVTTRKAGGRNREHILAVDRLEVDRSRSMLVN